METAARFFDHAQKKLQQVLEHEMPNIQTAADFVTESCAQGGKFYVFGSGHSHMIAEELYLRAGGLCLVHGILPPELMLHEMPNKSTYLERVEGYAKAMVELYHIEEKDTLMVISNSGRNCAIIDAALEAKKRGAITVAITSMNHTPSVTSRHSTGLNLSQVCDYVLDNGGIVGDASVELEGLEQKIAPTSSVIDITLVNLVLVNTVELLLQKGMTPPVFTSANTDQGDSANKNILETYKPKIPSL